jgi:catechol 2,3-dioxygenase-like lactoylglutathione lyase family enzyme
MLFRKIGVVILLVSNMERSIEFYKNMLGLPLKNNSHEWAEFFKDGTTLALHPMKKKLKEQAGSAVGMLVGFMVSNMDETYQNLKRKNVKFLKEPKEESFGKHAIILDPDGYMISIAQLRVKVAEEVDLFGALGIE